jgi:outer membrane immunogenic protein
MLRNWLVIVVLAVASVGSFTSLANAQQRSARIPAAIAVSNWSGFYIGGNAGYGSSGNTDLSMSDTFRLGIGATPNFWQPVGISDRASGATGGLHLGYNWKLTSQWLAGLEADWSWTGLKAGGSIGPLIEFDNTVALGTSSTMHTDVRGIGSIRGRVGYTQPTWMAYATGGWALADLRFTGDTVCPTGICAGSDTHIPVNASRTRSGWVVGGGVEFKGPASPWILGVEYLYYSFDGTDRVSGAAITTATGTPVIVGSCAAGASCTQYEFGGLAIQTIRARLSYKFD